MFLFREKNNFLAKPLGYMGLQLKKKWVFSLSAFIKEKYEFSNLLILRTESNDISKFPQKKDG